MGGGSCLYMSGTSWRAPDPSSPPVAVPSSGGRGSAVCEHRPWHRRSVGVPDTTSFRLLSRFGSTGWRRGGGYMLFRWRTSQSPATTVLKRLLYNRTFYLTVVFVVFSRAVFFVLLSKILLSNASFPRVGPRDVRSGLLEGAVVDTSTVPLSEYPTSRRSRWLAAITDLGSGQK